MKHSSMNKLSQRVLKLSRHSPLQCFLQLRCASDIKGPAKCPTLVKPCALAADPFCLDPKKPQPKVVIIGAGMAGLSAAQRLAQAGLNNFTVLEGTERPGGRIHSCWLGNVVGELGAQWIVGGSVANPIYTLACVEGLIQEPVPKRNCIEPQRLICLTSDGRAIESHVSSTAFDIYQNLKSQAISLFSLDSQKGHGTLMNFLFKRIKEELKSVPEDWRYDVARVVYGFTNNLKTRWGVDLNKLSSNMLGSFIDIPGSPVRVPLGYVGVLGPLLKSLPEKSVKYCHEVKSIKWDTGKPRAVVRSKEGEDITADYVLITVSLGVLKEFADGMFHPSLPDEKMSAIQCLGYGHLNKIILEYGKPFWAVGEGMINLAWALDELDAKDSWVKGISTIEEAPGSNNMLMTTVAGQEAIESEKCSDEEIAHLITQLLRQFTGDSTLPYPVNLIRSKWSGDRFFKGALSYMGVYSKVDHQCDLGAPVEDMCNPGPPVLLFAGEATSPGLFSTVQGARTSGIREAERILMLTKKFGGPPRMKEKDC